MNILAGWTGVGWWVALAMTMTAAHQRRDKDLTG